MAITCNANIINKTDGYLLDAESVRGGYIACDTLANLKKINTAVLKTGSLAYVSNDSVSSNNGYYRWIASSTSDGTSGDWNKLVSDLQELTAGNGITIGTNKAISVKKDTADDNLLDVTEDGLSVSKSSIDDVIALNDTVNGLSNTVAGLNSTVTGLDSTVTELNTTVNEIQNGTTINTFGKVEEALSTVNSTLSEKANLTDVAVKSLDANDKILSINEDKELSATLSIAIEGNLLKLIGKNDGEVIGEPIDMSQFQISGTLKNVEVKDVTVEGSSDTIKAFVFTFAVITEGISKDKEVTIPVTDLIHDGTVVTSVNGRTGNVTGLAEAISLEESRRVYTNRAGADALKSGFINYVTGDVMTHENYWHTGYIPVYPGGLFVMQGPLFQHFAFYGVDKSVITSDGKGNDVRSYDGGDIMKDSTHTSGYYYFTAPDKAYYARFTVGTSSINTIYLNSIASTDDLWRYVDPVIKPYGYKYDEFVIRDIDRDLGAAQKAIIDNWDDIIRDSTNLYDYRLSEAGYMSAEGVVGGDGTTHVHSRMIPVEPGKKLMYNFALRFVTAFDSNKQVLASKGSNNPLPSSGWTIPEGVFWIVVSMAVAHRSDQQVYLVPAGGDMPAYEPPGHWIKNTRLDFIQESANLFDYGTLVRGYFISPDGRVQEESQYSYTARPIKVEPGKVLRYTAPPRMLAAYDAAMSIAPAAAPDPSQWLPEDGWLVPEGIYYVKLTVHNRYLYTDAVQSPAKNARQYVVICEDKDYPFTGAAANAGERWVDDDALKYGRVDQAAALLGQDSARVTRNSLPRGTYLGIPEFPWFLKKNVGMSVRGNLSGGEAFSGLSFGKGYSDGDTHTSDSGDWIEITHDKVIWHGTSFDGTAIAGEEKPHGLTVQTYISAFYWVDSDSVCHITINTLGGTYTTEFQWRFSHMGESFVLASQDLADVVATVTSSDLRCPLLIFADSYWSVSNARVFGQLRNWGFTDYAVDAKSGQNPRDSIEDLRRILAMSIPKYIIWYQGMNGGDVMYDNALAELIPLCELHHITLILNRVPSVPTIDHTHVQSVVSSSGLRYIDSKKAVGEDGGTWYTGYLFTDGVHPTESGAQALAMQMLIDVPELMQHWTHSSAVS